MSELRPYVDDVHIFPPADESEAEKIEIPRGPNIKRPPKHEPMGDSLEARVATVQPVDISTGDLAPDGVEVMAYRSNVAAIAEFTFRHRDPDFRKRLKEWGSGIIVAGDNYGQGSSREHAALAPLHLGVKAVVAKSFARIHRRNLLAQGIVPLTFAEESDYDKAEVERCWKFPKLRQELEQGSETITVQIDDGEELRLRQDFSEHEREILLAGGLLRYLRERGPAEDQNGGAG
jgi:3-isopropylmalate dehydratase small subunit